MRSSTHMQCKWSSLQETTVVKSSNKRAKRKSRWKLKFHHQALPAEYQRHLQLNAKSKAPAPLLSITRGSLQSLPQPRCTRRLVTFVPSRVTSITPVAQCGDMQSMPSNSASPLTSSDSPFLSPRSTVRYNDLPYMGEMTLDNAVPRRGRKPKKADICHLIYKNYGTTVVDEPLNLCVRDLPGNGTEKRSAYEEDAHCTQADVSIGKFDFVGDTSALNRGHLVTAAPVDGPSTRRLSERKSRLFGRQLRRKNRKSVAREKLEKTFEERGFLIQTQQLESEQGATYCKFRQLRKFTRYLFRSWKHHLPGDVVDKQ